MITKNKFERYEEVRVSGRTNMFDVKMVEALSGLSREECFEIMKDYSKFKEEFAKSKDEVNGE